MSPSSPLRMPTHQDSSWGRIQEQVSPRQASGRHLLRGWMGLRRVGAPLGRGCRDKVSACSISGTAPSYCIRPISTTFSECRCASRPDRVAPGPLPLRVYHGDAAVGAPEGGEVKIRLGDGFTVLATALLGALPPVAAPGQCDCVDFGSLYPKVLVVQEELT